MGGQEEVHAWLIKIKQSVGEEKEKYRPLKNHSKKMGR